MSVYRASDNGSLCPEHHVAIGDGCRPPLVERRIPHRTTDAGRPFRVGSLAEVQLQTVAPTNQHQTCFWFSTYCLIAARGAPPVVATKYEFGQSVGSRLRRCGNSCRSACEERPFIALTSRCTPNCGSTSTSRWTWSGITSKAWSHAPCSWITSARTVFRRSSTG